METNMQQRIEKIKNSQKIFKILDNSKEIKSVFKLLIEEQDSKNLEHRIGVCLSKDNSLSLTEPCIGSIRGRLTPNCNKPKEKCPNESKLVTDYQTLIHNYDIGDMQLAIDRNIELFCVGRKNKTVECFCVDKKIRNTRLFIGRLYVDENSDLETEKLLKEKLEYLRPSFKRKISDF
jgi:hypothetical protein